MGATDRPYLFRFWLFFIVFLKRAVAQDTCAPIPSDPSFKRIGDTRFWIHHNHIRESKYFYSFQEAHDLCKKHGMRVPKIDSMTTFAVVARELEKLVWSNKSKDTWYWLDARWDKIRETYVWRDDNQPVKYGNYVQRYPRPIGVGAHTDFNNVYKAQENVDQCLALALPWPNNLNPKATASSIYGHSASIDERACDAKQHKHAMCESTKPACKSKRDTNYGITENKGNYYFEDGNWIIGERKFIINWRHRDKKASKKYCEDLDLQLYNPNLETDNCLIPFIKMWSRGITRSQWWTDWEYNAKETAYYDAFKNVAHVVKSNGTALRMQMKSSKTNNTFCVAMSLEYEFRNGQFPCPDQKRDDICAWHFIDYVPANCNNYHATICQHKDHANRNCKFQKSLTMNNVHEGLRITATVPFGWDTNEMVRRSRYKQVFGSLICPEGYRMLRSNNKEAWVKPVDINHTNIKPFVYDWQESYWVVDKYEFDRTETSFCTLSIPTIGDPYHREFVARPCYEWHFYLCEQIKQHIKPQLISPDPPNMNWGDTREYKRKYPHTNQTYHKKKKHISEESDEE